MLSFIGNLNPTLSLSAFVVSNRLSSMIFLYLAIYIFPSTLTHLLVTAEENHPLSFPPNEAFCMQAKKFSCQSDETTFLNLIAVYSVKARSLIVYLLTPSHT
ncbi:hypothetical protein XENORESO_013270 [Xenotaenia resolanae]|uniref:Uncharacterized protein n=1 Tax=Xenotaenia resolanae TaxID=208358 RepID=A0ABV0WD21_9TELE